MGMVQEFRAFATRGNVIDLAVGVIIGASFAKIVDSMVADLIMPAFGAAFGSLDFSSMFVVLGKNPGGLASLAELKKAGIPVLAYGNFLTILVNFLILAIIIFVMVKQVNRLKREVPPAAAPPTQEVLLLGEIRDALRR
jgi:large conductance mechanosensitive channel